MPAMDLEGSADRDEEGIGGRVLIASADVDVCRTRLSVNLQREPQLVNLDIS